MSEFNIYARKLDTAFKEARSEYNTAFRALQEAQQASRDANAWKPGDSAEEKQVNQTRKSNNSPAQQETRPIGIRNEPSAKGMFSAQRPDPAGNRADVSQGTLTRPTTGNRAAASKSVSMPSTLIKGSVKNSKEISSSRKQRREKHERK